MRTLEDYRFAFDIASVAMLLVNEEGNILLSNTLFDELFEYKASALVGLSVEHLVPESSRLNHSAQRAEYRARPSKRKMGEGRELFGVTSSGEQIPLELGLDTALVDGQDCVLVTVIDIRLRKQLDSRMHLAMDAAASAMVMVDHTGRIDFVNNAALSLFGYAQHELIHQMIEVLVPSSFSESHQRSRTQFTHQNQARPMNNGKQLMAIHKSGTEIPVEIALTPVETPVGRMVVSTITDIAPRLAYEKEMQSKNNELANLNEELSDFAYSASHDLKAPLLTMIGLLDLCQEDLNDGDITEAKTNIEKALNIGRRNASKIEQVLAIAQVDYVPNFPHPLDIEKLILQIWTDLTPMDGHKVHLKCRFEHVGLPALDQGVMTIVLENLLSNAIRYADEKKSENWISVETHSTNTTLTILVSDNGIGIPQSKHKDVFRMFQRIDERSVHGLGLSMVKKHVERLRGSISLTSNIGVGTQFLVNLPLTYIAQ